MENGGFYDYRFIRIYVTFTPSLLSYGRYAPILAEQLNDEHLKNGFVEYLDSRIEAVAKDLERYPDPKVEHSQHLKYLAKYYFDWFNHIKDSFVHKFFC